MPPATPLCPRCQTPLAPGSNACASCDNGPPLPRGLIDGRYKVERELGRGGMGVVYLAKDVSLGRMAAIKMLSKEEIYEPDQFAAFRREASAIASVRNEHVVHVYAYGEHEGSPFFAMEYVRGVDLALLIAQHTKHNTFVPLHRALTILDQVASALHTVHLANVLHRDVKPANIIIEEGSGRPVLIDFGLVSLLHNQNSVTGNAEGTPDYMAPEVWQPSLGDVTGASDVYSLACTAYELFTGFPPFVDAEGVAAIRVSHLLRPPPSLFDKRPDLAAFAPIISKAMAKLPADRHPGPRQFARALIDAAPSENLASTSDPPPSSLPALAPSATTPPPLPAQTAPYAAELPPASDRPVGILVIDDDPIFQRVIARAAQLAFYRNTVNISVAGSGAEALKKSAESMPDLVLLDYNMPGLNGLDTLSRLRALPSGAETRVIIVSGAARSLERWPFAVLGVQDFYDKSGGLPPLVGLIGQVADQLGLRSRAITQP